MNCHPSRIVAASAFALLALVARSVLAETLYAPIGARPIPLGSNRVACVDAALSHGWTVEPGGHAVRPPRDESAIGQPVVMTVAGDARECASSSASITLVAVGAAPVVDRASVQLDLDAGTATLRGRGLRGARLQWTAGARSGDDVCADPQSQSGLESCTFALPRALPADPSAVVLTALPPGAPGAPDAVGFDALGQRSVAGEAAFHPARVLVARVLPPEAGVDLQSGEARIALTHAEGVAAVECPTAACELDGSELVIREARTADETLEVRVRLRPHVFVQHGGGADNAFTVQIPVRRCPMAIVSAAPLRDVGDQRVVLRLGGACARDPGLRFQVAGVPVRVDRAVDATDARYVVLQLPRVESADVAVVVQRGDTLVGTASAATRAAPAAHARLELTGYGPIDFVPTNRDARLLLPAGETGVALVPVPVEGVYTVTHDAAGADYVRGVEGAAGSVALRLALRDHNLPAGLRELDLAVLTEPVDRTIRVANIPVVLSGATAEGAPLVDLICGDGQGHTARVAPGVTASLPFRARQTCRVVLHRERLRPEDGAQAIHLTIDLVGADGATRSDARVDQRVVLQPAREPRVLFVTGVTTPFDRVIVRVALVADDVHYAVAPEERSDAPPLQWSVVFGDDRFRIYATTAIPTGLFRIADEGHSGILTLNAGALLRLVWLSREGHESPVGLEAGIMWLGIAGDDARFSPRGQVALVVGLGVGVPIANATHAGQTSINLHVWLEYEVSRAFEGPITDTNGAVLSPGSPFGVVFGPSISIGDLGVNF